MPVTPDQPAPYAPSTAVIELIERHRNKGLPAPVDAGVLERAGISASLVSRTLQALAALDLIDVDGRPTQVLERMRLAPEAEFRSAVAEWLYETYADALKFVDPALDDESKVRDAFRKYTPVGQQARMVTLFLGLFRYAGIAPEKASAPASSLRKKAPNGKKSRDRSSNTATTNQDEKASAQREEKVGVRNADRNPPEYLSALLAKFPDFDPSWPDDIKAKWFEGFEKFMKGASAK